MWGVRRERGVVREVFEEKKRVEEGKRGKEKVRGSLSQKFGREERR